ncbi:MAG: hypothetical protein NTW19_16650 [Planctomycetota bacterium]|nr:hypothetical protein [Planctomycetota bacterium]
MKHRSTRGRLRPLAALATLVGAAAIAAALAAAWGCGQAEPDVVAQPQAHTPTWPAAPVAVSQTEAVIESFWDPSLQAERRWVVRGGGLETDWESQRLVWQGRPDAGSECQIERPYDDLDLGGFDRLTLRLSGPAGVKVDAFVTVDGKETTAISDAACVNVAQEISGPLQGGKLSRVRLAFRAPKGVRRSAVQLRWLMVSKPGVAWTPPANPFDGMIEAEPGGRFEPGLGIVMGSGDVERLRRLAATEACAAVWADARKKAAEQAKVDPAGLIRPFTLYNPKRFGRVADESVPLECDGLALALVGLVDRNEEYLRLAAMHAVALAKSDRWAEGFIDDFPGGKFDVSAFAQSLAVTRASLLLDFCWDRLTPEGRALVRGAIREKGLVHMRGKAAAGGVFGVLCNRAVVFGFLARVLSQPEMRDEARVQTDLRAVRERFGRTLGSMIADDGGIPMGIVQGQTALLQSMLPYHALARAMGEPVSAVVPARFRDAAWFLFEAKRDLPTALAAFGAGPLGEASLTGLCVPSDLFQATSEPTLEPLLMGMGLAWAPSLGMKASPPEARLMASYPESGWVFMGNADPSAPRVAFETGPFLSDQRYEAHRHAIAVDAWGQSLLLSRRPPGSEDARAEEARRTTAYNTLTPGGRQQDAAGNPSRGARLSIAEDLGAFAVVESENASAWVERVRRAQRRLIFVRPNVLVVEDSLGLTARETAVQSWNSLGEWNVLYDHACEASVGQAGVRVTCVLPARIELAVGEAGVHREGKQVLPVRRAAFSTVDASIHRIVTVIEAIPPASGEAASAAAGGFSWGSAGPGTPASVRVVEGKSPVIEITQGERVTRIATGPAENDQIPGCRSDGSVTVVTTQGAAVLAAAAFEASSLEVAGKRVEGLGFLKYLPSHARK